MKFRSLLTLAALAGAGFALGQSTTNPVGYVTIECKANSDTIVGVPLRQSAEFAGSLSGDPDTTTTPGSAILTLSGTPGLAADAFADTHYAKFTNTLPTPAAGDGQWFVITANDAGTLTVDLNGGSIDAVDGAGLEIIKFWTLAELFDPADSTTDVATTGNAIVASTSTGLSGRRTTVLIPNLTGQGINLAPNQIYFIHDTKWKKASSGDTDFGSFQLWPDSYFVIRNPSAVTASTYHTITGEVDSNSFEVSLATRAVGSQDNFVGLPRPVDVPLSSLNLAESSAFIPSTGLGLSGRRDQLLVFNNSIASLNKAASSIYFYYGGKWKKPGDSDTDDRGSDVIPAGSGFIVRKYQSGTGVSSAWSNTTSY